MILDHINNLNNYTGMHPGIVRALEFIRDADWTAYEDTTYEVDGRNLYFFIQTYDTRAENLTPEAHRNYVDIQFMITGAEKMGVVQLADTTEEVEANPQKDIWFYHGPMDYVTVKQGMFAVFFPNDAHAPCISPAEAPATVRKCVFKVRV